jgi:hypothetical protein
VKPWVQSSTLPINNNNNNNNIEKNWIAFFSPGIIG